MEAELRKRHLDSKELLKEGKLAEVLERFSLTTMDDLFSAVGDGSLTVNQVANRIKESYFPNALVEDIINKPPVTTGSGRERVTRSLRVKGVDDIVIRLAHCCNPLPGDEVLGYITRGRGVSVHRTDCPNMQNYLRNEANRILEMEWASDKGNYTVEIEIDAIDRDRLTSDVMTLIADMRIPVNSVFSRATKNGLAVMNLKLEIVDMAQFNAVRQRLQKVKGIQDIRRVLPGDNRG